MRAGLPQQRVDVLEQRLGARRRARQGPRLRPRARSSRPPVAVSKASVSTPRSPPLSRRQHAANAPRTGAAAARPRPPPATRRRRSRPRSTARDPPLRGGDALEAVEVEVRDLDRGAVVAVADRVRRARDVLAHAERRARAAHERRLAGAELARDGHDVARRRAAQRAPPRAPPSPPVSGSSSPRVRSNHACIRNRRDKRQRP